MASTFKDAVTDVGDYAGRQFDEAYGKLTSHPFTLPVTSLTPEQKKELQSWQGQMAASFKQLGDAEKQAQQQAGYADVVALMHTTAVTAKSVSDQIVTIMNALPTLSSPPNAQQFQSSQINQIAALREVLNALAALSPAAVWRTPPEGDSKA